MSRQAGSATHASSAPLAVRCARVCTQMKCTKCGHRRRRYERTRDIALELGPANKRVKSLDQAVHCFTNVQDLYGGNKVECGRCKKRVRTVKSYTLSKVEY